MKTDIDIKDDIYNIILDSELYHAVTGSLSKTIRRVDSDKEDIVISILANNNGQLQECFVNVNIYVKDVKRVNYWEEDTQRLRTLCKLSEKLFEVVNRGEFRITLDSQRVFNVDENKEHMINNKLLYMQCNE